MAVAALHSAAPSHECDCKDQSDIKSSGHTHLRVSTAIFVLRYQESHRDNRCDSCIRQGLLKSDRLLPRTDAIGACRTTVAAFAVRGYPTRLQAENC